MLQIIAWLGCAYLVIKGLQMLQVSLNAGTSRNAQVVGYVGFLLALGGAIALFFVVNKQASGVGGPLFAVEDDARRAVQRLGVEPGGLDRALSAARTQARNDDERREIEALQREQNSMRNEE